jgi:hypothetical protein
VAAQIHSFHRLRGSRRDAHPGNPIDSQLAVALRERLTDTGHAQLASTVDQLGVVEHCRCGEPGCESFYTVPAHQVPSLWERRGKTIDLAPGLAVDVANGEILAVEILHGRSD